MNRRWAAAAGVVLALLVILSACSKKEEAPPKLSFDKEQAALGTVPRDHWGMVTFLAVNRGKGLLKIGPMEITAQQGDATAKVAPGILEVKPDEIGVIGVEFTGHGVAGAHRLSLKVPSNDPQKPVSTLTLTFNVDEKPTPPPERSGPRLRVDKGMVDAGPVPSDHPLYERFLLRNDGDAPLVLQGIPVVKVLDGC